MGAGGAASGGIGDVKYSGGDGAGVGVSGGGGGGGGAGASGDGGSTTTTTGGTGGSGGGGNGGDGSTDNATAPGGGGAGNAVNFILSQGLPGRRGEVRITYPPSEPPSGHPTMRRWGGIPGMRSTGFAGRSW